MKVLHYESTIFWLEMTLASAKQMLALIKIGKPCAVDVQRAEANVAEIERYISLLNETAFNARDIYLPEESA